MNRPTPKTKTAPKAAAAAARGERLEARISAEQKGLLQRAADLQGRTLTDFVVQSAHDAAVLDTLWSAALDQGNFDLVASGVSITAERQKAMDFSSSPASFVRFESLRK